MSTPRPAPEILEMADHPLVKAYERAVTIIERLDLAQRLPQLNANLEVVNGAKPGPLQDWLKQNIVDQITQYEQEHLENPFFPPLTVPPGTFAPLTEKRSGQPLPLEPEDFASNTLIGGATGSAKSACAMHIVDCLQPAAPSVDKCYVDPKPDWQYHAARDERCLIITEDVPLCVTVPPSFMTPDYYEQLLAKTYAESFYGAAHTLRLFTEAGPRARAAHPDGHSLKDRHDALEHPPKKDFSFQERDSRTYALGRMDLIRAIMPGIFHAKPPRCFTMEDLCHHPVYFPMPLRTPPWEFLTALWVQVRLHYHRHQQHSGLRTLVVMDEGLQLWQADAPHRITGTPLLDHIVSQTRSSGLGFLITTTSIKQVSPLIRANTNLQVVMRLVDGAEVEDVRRTFGLNTAQTTYLQTRLARGELLFRLSHKYPEPRLCTFPKPTYAATVTAAEWQAAIERTLQRLPNEPHTPDITTSASAPEPVHKTPSNALTRDLLTCIAQRGGIATVTEAYNGVGCHYSTGDAAKSTGLATKMLTATPIIVRQGSGGRAIGLRITPEGYEWLGITPPRRSRGAGAQSEYLIQRLHELLPDSSIETSLDGKAPDLLLRVKDEHDALINALAAHGQPLGESRIAPNTLLAIEVECSDPAKTIPNNLVKNRSAGITSMVFAVMPKQEQQVIQLFLSMDEPLDGVMVINALTLLDTLRQGEPQ
jgi:hypothetical protein